MTALCAALCICAKHSTMVFMPGRSCSSVVLLLGSVLFIGCAPKPAAHPTPQATLTYLASDALDGRGVETAGLNSAADYIAGQFRDDGLKPFAGEPAYFQPFEFPFVTTVDPSTELRINDSPAGRDQSYRPLSVSGEGAFSAPLVFAGYGITAADPSYDDYAGIDVKGKAVLLLRAEPRDKSGNSVFGKSKNFSDHATFVTKVKNAQDHGAVAVLICDPAGKTLIPFTAGPSNGIVIPVLAVSRSVADAWLAQGGEPDSAATKSQIDSTLHPASRAIEGVSISGNVKLIRKIGHVKNVVAFFPANGPGAEEYVVVGAHYDHLGKSKGEKPSIYHGADDNASGTTALLEVAKRITDGPPLKRSIIFVAFSAEEEGLIGSDYFVKHPPVPLEKIVAMLNLDMVGRVRNETIYVAGGGTAAGFHDLIKRVDDASPLSIKSMGEGGLGPSDHMSFALKKIPILFLFSGLHADYHRPTDTADKINFAGISEVAALAEKMVDELAVLPRQTYVSAADASQENVSIGYTGPGPGGGRRVTLGVIPDYTTGDDVTGVRITDTIPESPANKGGLLGGDVIVKLGETKIESLEGLSAALQTAEASKPTTVTVLRNGKRVELPVTLIEKIVP